MNYGSLSRRYLILLLYETRFKIQQASIFIFDAETIFVIKNNNNRSYIYLETLRLEWNADVTIDVIGIYGMYVIR